MHDYMITAKLVKSNESRIQLCIYAHIIWGSVLNVYGLAYVLYL